MKTLKFAFDIYWPLGQYQLILPYYKASKAWVLPRFWISIHSYKKQAVKKNWGGILGLAWIKFAVASAVPILHFIFAKLKGPGNTKSSFEISWLLIEILRHLQNVFDTNVPIPGTAIRMRLWSFVTKSDRTDWAWIRSCRQY